MVRELWKKQLDFDGLVVIQSHYNDRVRVMVRVRWRQLITCNTGFVGGGQVIYHDNGICLIVTVSSHGQAMHFTECCSS